MRRSATVIAPPLASAAVALLAACKSTEPQRCIDENNRVVDPTFCKNLPANGQAAGTLNNNGSLGIREDATPITGNLSCFASPTSSAKLILFAGDLHDGLRDRV